jgi:hypothetical protein
MRFEPNITVNESVLGRYFQEHFHVLAGKVRLANARKRREYLWPGPRPLLGYQTLRTLALSDEVQCRERLLNTSFPTPKAG